MKYRLIIFAVAYLLFNTSVNFCQPELKMPNTPASGVLQDLISAYNTGSRTKIESFLRSNYLSIDTTKLISKPEYWMDLFSRFGPVDMYSVSINKPFDIEVWVQGRISRFWFAPEIILNKETGKIKATGLLMGTQPPGTSAPAGNDEELISKIDKYLTINAQDSLFQGNVLIQHKDRIVFNKSYGFKNFERNEKNSADTRMRISSVTKIFTAIACLQLAQNGAIELNTPVSKYLPELPENISGKITIYNLLTHTSGYELDGIEGFRDELEKTNSISGVYSAQLKYLPGWEFYNNFSVLQKFDYSNDSYDLLAVIIEKVSGMAYQEYLRKNIFDVCKMPNTSFSVQGVSTPYRFDIKKGGLMDHESFYPNTVGKISGAAGLISTTGDLLNFFNTLRYNNSLLDMPHKSLLNAPLVKRDDSEYQSLGLNISYDQVLNIGHNGTNIGNSAEFRYFPDSDYLMIVLCNNRSGAHNFYSFFKNNIPVTR